MWTYAPLASHHVLSTTSCQATIVFLRLISIIQTAPGLVMGDVPCPSVRIPAAQLIWSIRLGTKATAPPTTTHSLLSPKKVDETAHLPYFPRSPFLGA
ncbi:hypothetical protein B0H63DRAFT_475396 [Podospora didyma]|uniref:Uncharacterized protein n=1 Tax=Podospora didyma TaxID=330526 RepID=A0AAE0NGZ2_9PEZI|nr:hypothetical protein B0H63DRAFT_475396 [Podospora didyma]